MEAFPKLNQARGIFNIDGVPGSTSNLTQYPWWLEVECGQLPPGFHCSSQGALWENWNTEKPQS